MKKLLVFMMVLCFTGVASAATVSLIAPVEGDPGSATDPLELGEIITVYLAVSDNALDTLSITITGAGITGGITAAEAPGYGGKGTFYSPPDIWFRAGSDGWQTSTSADSVVSGGGTKIEMGLSQVGNVIYGPTTTPVVTFDMVGFPNMTVAQSPIAYLTLQGTGSDMTLSIANGSQFGSTSIETDLVTVPGFGAPLTIEGIPEPMTVVLLGLGGLLLRRRR